METASETGPAREPSAAHPVWERVRRIPKGWRVVLAVALVAILAATSWAALGGFSSVGTRDSPSEGQPAALGLVTVPDLSGERLVAAEEALRGLDLDWSTSPYPSGQPPGTVLHQIPFAGIGLERGGSVSLVIAEPFPKLPKLVGKKLKHARGSIVQLDLRLRVRRQASGRSPGTVLSQDPAAGTRMRPRRLVTLVVAKPPPPAPPEPAPAPAPQPEPAPAPEPEPLPWEQPAPSPEPLPWEQ